MLWHTDAQMFCNQHGITYTVYTHPPLYTTQDSQHYDDIIPWLHTKNLFLRGKKDGNRHTMLVCLSSKKRLSIKTFGRLYGFKDVSFWSPAMLEETLGLLPWSVCIFGCLRTPLPVYLHDDLLHASLVWRHPCVNTQTWTFDLLNRSKLYHALGINPQSFGDECCIMDETRP